MNFLVETKIEYTMQLVNIISPFIYDGIQSLYEDSLKLAKENEELMIFQSFLKKIPKWNNNILIKETTRILNDSNCKDLLQQLLNAVIKSNIMVLTNTPPEKKHTIKIPKTIDFQMFIHNAYIETAKLIYNNPYLFYHKYSLYDIKKNQRDSLDNIKIAINESIRKMLPLQIILKEYLGEDSIINNDNFEKNISDNEKMLLSNLIKNDGTKVEKKITNNINENNKDNDNNGTNNDKDVIKHNNIDIDHLKELLKNNPLISSSSDINVDCNNHEKVKTELDNEIKETKLQLNTQSNTNQNTNPTYSLKKIVPVLQNSNNNKKLNEIKIESVHKIDSEIKADSEIDSVSYYKNSKVIDSFSNKSTRNNNASNIGSLFLSNEPKNVINSVNSAYIQRYLHDEQPSIKLSEDSHINSIQNVRTDKFKNKYYQV